MLSVWLVVVAVYRTLLKWIISFDRRDTPKVVTSLSHILGATK